MKQTIIVSALTENSTIQIRANEHDMNRITTMLYLASSQLLKKGDRSEAEFAEMIANQLFDKLEENWKSEEKN